jgi:uncharacterized coiled-coil protein SlyX
MKSKHDKYREGDPMATKGKQANLVDEGIDRIQSAVKSIEDEVQRAQKKLEQNAQRFSDQTDRNLEKLRDQFAKSPLGKSTESLRSNINDQLEEGLERFLGTFQIASRNEIAKLDRKLGRISRRLTALDKAVQQNGSTAPSPE